MIPELACPKSSASYNEHDNKGRKRGEENGNVKKGLMKWINVMGLRKRVWEIVEVAGPGDFVSRVFDIFILSLIFLNVAGVIIGSVESVQVRFGGFLRGFEIFSVAIFTIEYVLRIWACVSDQSFRGAFGGRIRLACKPMSLIDMLAILPFYLPFVGVDLRFIRALRLMRIFRVAKVARYYSALQLIKKVFINQREELVLTSMVMILLLVTSSSMMYYCENPTQPDAFPNIPTTMWWSVITLTTVGYGDVYPITVAGKILGAVIAILGIGMFALPTGILGAGFVEEIQKVKRRHTCPHCGNEI